MFDFFEVGGAVRDKFLGVNSKDVDFSCVAQNPDQFDSVDVAFQALIDHLKELGFKGFSTNKGEFIIKEDFLTVRVQVPQGHVLSQRTTAADFVLARLDGPSSDGRRPDFVRPGSLMDDLARRDFTVNAMAMDTEGNLIDPFDGMADLHNRVIRFVGEPMHRIEEDGLRILRALRFTVTKEMDLHDDLYNFFDDNHVALGMHHLRGVSTDRIRDELNKMFSANTLKTLGILETFPGIKYSIFNRGDLNLMATSKKF